VEQNFQFTPFRKCEAKSEATYKYLLYLLTSEGTEIKFGSTFPKGG